jgi:hypothetical protein
MYQILGSCFSALHSNKSCESLCRLINGEPQLMNLQDFLQTFLDFRCTVVQRRAQHQLTKAEQRDHLVQVRAPSRTLGASEILVEICWSLLIMFVVVVVTSGCVWQPQPIQQGSVRQAEDPEWQLILVGA